MMQPKTPSTVTTQREAVATADVDYVVGIDLGATNLRVALADMSGTIAAKWSASTAGIRDAKAVVELIRAGVDNLMRQVSAPAHFRLVVVSLSGPGGSTLRMLDCLTGQLILEKRFHAPHTDHLDPSIGAAIAFIPESVDVFALTNGRTIRRIGADGAVRWAWESHDKS